MEGWDEFAGNSPHRPWVDAVKIGCAKCGAAVSRIEDVGNPWLDAGIVSFSTLGYRHDPDYWKEWFPADWISESFPGQFRNWFYSLLTMGAILRETEAFKLVFSYALMRDERGEEMHKSKGTAIWFEDAAENMGVDAMRWTFSRHTPENNINFGFGDGGRGAPAVHDSLVERVQLLRNLRQHRQVRPQHRAAAGVRAPGP